MEVRDVAPGLWIWRLQHPQWKAGQGWDPIVTCTCVESRGEALVLDPLAPPIESAQPWHRLDASQPSAIVVLKPDHVRDVDVFVRRYHARAVGSFVATTFPKPNWSGSIPGVSFREGSLRSRRSGSERDTAVAPEQRALVFADALTAPRGELRVWATPWHHERALPALRALLDLPFELVIVSHGEPVHTRSAYEHALSLPPWNG